MRLHILRFVSLFAALACLALPLAAQVEFNRDVRPILSERCYTCHGPDETKRLSGSTRKRGRRRTWEDVSRSFQVILDAAR